MNEQTADDPTPSLHPHRVKQELHRYYESVRQRTPHRYSAPHGFSRLGRSLSRPGHRDAGIGVRLLTFRVRAADQAHVACMPDTTWPVSGYPPGSSRSYPYASVLMPSKTYFDTSTTVTLVFLIPT